MHTLVLGLGNELLADEGVGVHAVRLLQQKELPDNITVLEVGTSILDILEELECAERVFVLDAMKDDGPPGTVYKIALNDCSGSMTIASMHGFDIFRVMALTRRTETPPVLVFGVEPEQICWSMTLSSTVTTSLPYLMEAVWEELTNINQGN